MCESEVNLNTAHLDSTLLGPHPQLLNRAGRICGSYAPPLPGLRLLTSPGGRSRMCAPVIRLFWSNLISVYLPNLLLLSLRVVLAFPIA